ncbi:hypothetical protein D6745_01370 [Candidatus Woesearchaeota archaeon]|nr:MAG: hypothetical protein D6745_01370 [Candidatus Woesearchaeota archaeon]
MSLKFVVLLLFVIGCSSNMQKELTFDDFKEKIVPEMKQLTQDISEVEAKYKEIIETKDIDECNHIGNISQSSAILTAYREVGVNFYNDNKEYFDKYCDQTPGCDVVETNVGVWEENIDLYNDFMDKNNDILKGCGYTFTMEELLDEARVIVDDYLEERGDILNVSS